MTLIEVNSDDIKPRPSSWTPHDTPQPEVTETESRFEHIQGGAIDAFDREGWDVVHCRVMRQLLDRKAGYHKNGVLFIGEPYDVSGFHERLCKHPFALPEWKSRMEGLKETLPTIPGLMWIGNKDYDNGWAGKSSWGQKELDQAAKELEAHHLLATQRSVKRLIEEVEHSLVTHSPITTVVLRQPAKAKYLDRFCKALPDVTVYSLCDMDPTDEGRSLVQRFGGSGASLWDTQSEMTDEKELPDVVKHIAHEGESTWIFGYAKHGKTWIMLCVVKALLTGEPLFNVPNLEVPRKSRRVIYLCPEASRTSLRKRLKMLGLIEYLYDPITNPTGRLYLRSLSKGPKLNLDAPELLAMTKGADIFIDTAIRYMEGDENSSGDVKVLTENILNLLAMGARSMWVAAHSGKSFASATEITLENCARGSSEFAAALTNAIGVVQLDKEKNLIHFHFIDGRDMDEPVADMHLQGRPYLYDTGNFQVTENVEPFKGRNSKSGPKDDPARQSKIDFAKSVDGSYQEKAAAVNEKFGSKHSKSTISEWLKEDEQGKHFKEGLTTVKEKIQ
jgi:hypothetical protein